MTDTPTSVPPAEAGVVMRDVLYDPEEQEAVESRVGAELDEELSQHLLTGRRTSDIGQTLLAALVVFVFWEVVDSVVALGWFTLFAALAALRASCSFATSSTRSARSGKGPSENSFTSVCAHTSPAAWTRYP